MAVIWLQYNKYRNHSTSQNIYLKVKQKPEICLKETKVTVTGTVHIRSWRIDAKHSLGVASHYHCRLRSTDYSKSAEDYERCSLSELGKSLSCTHVVFSFWYLRVSAAKQFYYPRDAMLARVFATATCPSVRPSVRLSHAGIVTSRAKVGSWNVHHLIAPSL